MKQFPLLLVLALFAAAQTQPTEPRQPQSDPAASAKLAAAFAVFAGGKAPKAVHIEGAVTEHAGAEFSGTFIYDSASDGSTTLQLNLGDRSRSEKSAAISDRPDCSWTSADGKIHKGPVHNCLTPSGWLLPLLATKPDQPKILVNPGRSVPSDSIAVTRQFRDETPQRLSSAELTFDKTSIDPVKLSFNVHPDADYKTDIPVEITYSDYRVVDGIRVPFAVKKTMNGTTVLELSVTTVQVTQEVK